MIGDNIADKLKDKYINCSSCETVTCCNFSGDFVGFITKQALDAIQPDFINLVKLEKIEHEEVYAMRNMSCPALDEQNRCTIYGQRDKLGQIGCIKFPIYIATRRMKGTPMQCLIIDTRCGQVEENLDNILEDIAKVSMPVKIKFNMSDRTREISRHMYLHG